MPTQAVFYRAPDGTEPVADFLDDEFPIEPRKKPSARELQAAASKRVTIDLQIDRLNDLANDDPPLPFPHTSQIDGPLRELRCHYGREHYRVLYRRSGLLHMIRKTSKTVPRAEIEIAKERWQDFKNRMEARPRKSPRAAGGDAP